MEGGLCEMRFANFTHEMSPYWFVILQNTKNPRFFALNHQENNGAGRVTLRSYAQLGVQNFEKFGRLFVIRPYLFKFSG